MTTLERVTTIEHDAAVHLIEDAFRKIAQDVSMIVDRSLEIEEVKFERAQTRAVGRGQIHISFKLGIQHKGRILHGALVVPLPDAISLACYLMMVPDDGVKARRTAVTLDGPTKDAMLEIGNFIGGATDAALRDAGLEAIKVRSEGCQGVRANVRPAFEYQEGSELLIGRARARLHNWPLFDIVLMFPALELPDTR